MSSADCTNPSELMYARRSSSSSARLYPRITIRSALASIKRQPAYVKTPWPRPSTKSSAAACPSREAAQRTFCSVKHCTRENCGSGAPPPRPPHGRRCPAAAGENRTSARRPPGRGATPSSRAPAPQKQQSKNASSEDARRNLGEDRIEVVVEDVGPPIPVHVVRTDDLVERVGQLVAVSVSELRAVTREVERDHVALLRIADGLSQPVHDVRLRRALVHEHADALVRDAEALLHDPPDERDVVHAAVQRRDVRALVDVDPD